MPIKIEKANPQPPSKFLIIGEPFSGKTTLAAKAPKPLFISTDGNAAKAGLDAVNVKSIDDIRESVELFMKSQDYHTLVLDTIEGVVDIFSAGTLAELKNLGFKAEGGGELKSLQDLSWGKGTTELKKKLSTFANALANLKGNVVILSYTKRRIDEVNNAVVLDSELKDIKLFTKFMDAQVITLFDGEKYKSHLISKREIMVGEADTSEIKTFLDEIGYELPRKSVKLSKVRK